MAKRSIVLALLALVLARPAWAEAPAVAVSIKPLHSLVAEVMKGVGEPRLVVAGNASPHTYALRPSDARAIEQAGLVVWVGPQFEAFLARPLGTRADTLAMADIPGMVLLPAREGGVWDDDPDHRDEHGHQGNDGHLWLDPVNAGLLVQAVAGRLSALDPANAKAYAANAAAALKRLKALDAELAARLRPLSGRTYVVFHDALQYLEKRYGLTPAGSITVDPERPPSPRRMAALRERLKKAGAACVFREPQFAGSTVQALAESAKARVGLLDPEGATLDPGPDLYFRLMTGLAGSLAECLSAR